ncbi:MAG TPA: hypothetical protein P5558_14725 [Geminicoccaceae bacterium]|nr:hypothetical protein [Geminicoccaceae bacterium]
MASKVAKVTFAFWVMKIIATTLGETTGDFIAQTLALGYVAGLAITATALIVILVMQIRAERFHAALFWAAIVATTTAGTEVSDLMDRTLGFGYVIGSLVLLAGLAATLLIWRLREKSLSVYPIVDRRVEIMFWIAVVFSNSLGTAFGDALVDVVGLSYIQGAVVTSAVIGVVLLLHYATSVDKIMLFWIAFVFTRPFGATFGDFLTKPMAKGGLELGTLHASAVALVLLSAIVLVTMWRQRPRAIA